MNSPTLTRNRSQTPANLYYTCLPSSPLCPPHMRKLFRPLQRVGRQKELNHIYRILTVPPCRSIKHCTTLLPSRINTLACLMQMRLTGTNLICPRKTNTSGTVLYSEVLAGQAARIAVSLRHSGFLICADGFLSALRC